MLPPMSGAADAMHNGDAALFVDALVQKGSGDLARGA